MPGTNIGIQKVSSHDYKSPSLFHFCARLIQSASHCFFEIHNKIILRATTRSPKWHVPFRLLERNNVYTVWCAAQTYNYRWRHEHEHIGTYSQI